MKILAINNYSLETCLKKSNIGVMPAHHTWGCDYFLQKGYTVDVKNFNNSGGGKKDFYHSDILFAQYTLL